ncbi:MAG: hypothetical protein LUE86_02190, partial [Clostridiales bacterium]|nr:hypothetical protein [Clostridiales bacterium]
MIEDGETVFGFYPFENRSGKIGSNSFTYSYTFQIGFLKSAFVQPDGSYGTVTVKGHLNRLYYDESEWVTTAGTNEKVDDSVSFTIEDYGFNWAGYIYNHEKWNDKYEYSRYNHNSPSKYKSRLNTINIYNGTAVTFYLYGIANRNYASSYSMRSRSANTTGVSQIGINGNEDNYALVLGDDKLAVVLTDGSIRNLTDDEYDISYITIPYDSYGYDYEVFGAYTQDTEFDNYFSIGTGNTASKKTINFPDNIKAMYIRVNDITGSYNYTVYVSVKLHLDWDEEQTKAAAGEATVDPEGHLINFSYLRSLYYDTTQECELNDCGMSADNYSGSYGEALAARDINIYDEYLMRAYSNVWLRSPTMSLSASTQLRGLSGIEDSDNNFGAYIVSEGSISSDSEDDSLTSFSLYSVLPEGMEPNFDKEGITLAGSGTSTSGTKLSSSDFENHVTYSIGEYNGKTMIIADFNFSDMPLDASQYTEISIGYYATLSYMDYLMYGNTYRAYTYLMVHDDGIENITGSSIMADRYDIDGNGLTTDKMAYDSASKTISDPAIQWQEHASKNVKTYYSEGYVTDALTVPYDGTADAESIEKASYSYRLEFGLGSNSAKNIDFFDRIEQGASIATNENENEYTDISTEWRGTFQSVDTSYAEKIGLIPTIYYSTNENQELKTTDNGGTGWTDVAPNDLSDVKAVWIHLDTSNKENEVMNNNEVAYIIINMLAPEDETLVHKKAVNQYYVQYDAYGITSTDDFEARYELPSAETYVTLLNNIGSITLKKVDGDHEIGTDSAGNTIYASLSGAVFQIYDSSGNALYGEDGISLNALNQIDIKNVECGLYYWQEISAPEGYMEDNELHPFTIDTDRDELIIKNYHDPGEVILTKYDSDNTNADPLAGASYELYTSTDDLVFAENGDNDGEYIYSETGTISTFTTNESGTITVTNLPWGSYYFVETEAPLGYDLNSNGISFTVGRYNLTAEVNGKDTEQTASVLLTKKDASDNSITLKNAYYDLYRQTDSEEWEKIYERQKTNAAGEMLIENLKFGNYKFVEVQSPIGYELATGESGEVTFTLDATTVGKVVTVSHTDIRKNGLVTLRKTSDNGFPLPGAVFDLYYGGTIIQSGITTGENGYTDTITDLEWGDYYFLETSAPKGYSVSTEPIAFTINANNAGVITEVTAVDTRIKGSVKLVKKDEDTQKELLHGAVFSLYTNDGVLVQSNIITGDDGTVTVTDLDWGSYYFEETKAPDGYQVSNNLVRFSINADNCALVQEDTCYDPIGKAQITVKKVIN